MTLDLTVFDVAAIQKMETTEKNSHEVSQLSPKLPEINRHGCHQSRNSLLLKMSEG